MSLCEQCDWRVRSHNMLSPGRGRAQAHPGISERLHHGHHRPGEWARMYTKLTVGPEKNNAKVLRIYGEGNGTPLHTLAWKIPWTEEPSRLQSMGSLRVRHDWATSLSLFTFMHWRRKWQPTPVFLPGESQGRRSLLGCHLWGCTESDTTEAT